MKEVLNYLKDNFSNPDATLGIIFYALITLLIVIIVAAIVRRIFGRISETAIRKFKADETSFHFMKGVISIIIYFAGAVVFVSLIPRLHALMSALLASAGITAIVIGLAAQNTLSNIVSGFLITIFKPVRIKDIVTIGQDYGTVEDITLMYTVVKTWDQRRLIIPNSTISSSTLVNYSHTDPKMLVHVEIGISYDSDIDKARNFMIDEAVKSEYRLKSEQEPFVRVIEVGEYAIVMRLYMWVGIPDNFYLAKFQLMERIKKRFDSEGIEIPFPYRTVVYKKDLEAAAA